MEIEDLQNLSFKDFRQDDNFKISDDRLPSNKEYSVYDVRIKQSKEHQAFAKEFKKYSEKTRRGLTFMVKKDDINNFQVIRKGLPKFFDLNVQDFVLQKNPKISLYKKDVEISVNKLSKQDQLTVYMTKKLNGMNMQISYCKILDQFLICTKNTCLIAKNLKEAEQDKDYFNQHNINIAQSFFEVFNNQTEEQKNKIKQILQDYTMVGEYVGGVINQHVTNELDPYMQFYAIVKKQSFNNDIVLTEQAEKMVKDMGFKFVEYEKFLGNKEGLFKVLNQQLKKCAEEGLQTIGEGYVLYFEYNNKNILIAKLKGLVYRIERKYREFAKSLFVKGEENFSKTIQREINEFQSMMKEYNLEKKEVERRVQEAEQTIHQIIQDFQNKMLNVDDWIGYRFKLNQTPSEKPIFVIIPLGIPGSGKSYFYNNVLKNVCNELQFGISYISSDEIRGKLIKKQLLKNDKLTSDQLHENTNLMCRNIYNDQLIRILIQAKYDIRKTKDNGIVIFLDKNYNSKSLNRIIDLIKLQMHKQNLKIFVTAPKIDNNKILGFSNSDIFVCLKQVKNRNNHKTLQFEGLKTLQIIKDFAEGFYEFLIKSFDIDGAIQYSDLKKIQIQQEDLSKLLSVKDDQSLVNILDSIQIDYDDNQENRDKEIQDICQIFCQNMKYQEKVINFKYLGIDMQSHKDDLFNLLKKTLLQTDKRFLINEIFQNNDWKKNNFIHVTLLHQNDMENGDYQQQIENFEENQQVSVTIKSILITVGLNVNFYVEIPNELKMMGNKLYHITLATQNSSPYVSNFILSQMKKKNRLDSGFDSIQTYYFKKQKYDCYIFNDLQDIEMQGITKKFYY